MRGVTEIRMTPNFLLFNNGESGGAGSKDLRDWGKSVKSCLDMVNFRCLRN